MSTNSNLKKLTIQTYNDSALELAEYFRGIGSRVGDIEKAFNLCGKPNPDVLEIGCGDGRDAKEIVARTNSYLGFDISEGLLQLAQEYVPEANFVVADAIDFDYGNNRFDVVFAFASLLHLDKDELRSIFKKIHAALRDNGILYLSLKQSNKYKEELKKDKFGSRIFYFYNPELIDSLASWGFEIERTDSGFITTGNTQWFEMALRKK